MTNETHASQKHEMFQILSVKINTTKTTGYNACAERRHNTKRDPGRETLHLQELDQAIKPNSEKS
jgi:hypothetical protein